VVDNLGLCTILTPDELNNLASLLVAPMTTSNQKIPSRVECYFEGAKGYIMVDQIKSVEKYCFIKKLGQLESEVQVKLCGCLEEFFAF
jgi:mRNA interferase MazF